MRLNLKDRIWDISTLIFIIFVLVWGVKRAQQDERWSAWALGDAQNLNAALHFVEEGFKEHHFLPYYHAGYLGKSFGNESKTGYYTRYPPFSPLFLGLQLKWFGHRRFYLKSFSVIISAFALLFCYGTFTLLFSKRIAFFSTFFIGSSVGFLQFIDCLASYLYSEFFRFTILFLFLLSERKKNQSLYSILCLCLAWTLLFFESLNSLDYFLFFPLFFILYYKFFDPKGSLPIGKILILLSAPLLGYSLHFINVTLALRQFGESSVSNFLKGFLDKTAPFHNGLFSTTKFIFYFLKTMNSHMTRDNFGFGFISLVLLIALIYYFRNNERDKQTKTLLLFGIPSISWWIVFSNHAASFFYTPMHLFPFFGLLLGLSLDNFLKSNFLCQVVLIGILIQPIYKTSRYLLDYPNPIDPSKNATLGELNGLKKEEIEALSQLSRSIQTLTNKGDIILVPKPMAESEHFFEYYSQRRMDGFGDGSVEDLKRKIEELNKYRIEGEKKFKHFNPNFKIYALYHEKKRSQALDTLLNHSKNIIPIENNWVLIPIS